MSVAIFHDGIARILQDGFDWEDAADVLAVTFGRGQVEQRAARGGDRIFRTYQVPFRVREATRQALDAFFVARNYEEESFLFVDPHDYIRTGAALTPASDGAQTVFTVLSTGVQGGDYPKGNARLYRAGVLDTGTLTVQTEARTLTTSVAPLTGAAMTADYEFYRRVVLRGRYRWRRVGHGALYETEMAWAEVVA